MNDTHVDDNDLIIRCLQGDTKVFEQLVTRYQEPVLTLCWGIMRNREEARDATQDTFVRAYRNLERFDRRRSFKSWLYSIAYHRCLDKIRKERSFRLYVKKTNVSESWSEDPAPEFSMAPGIPAQLGPHLDRLKDRERAALLLKARDGYSAAEIAEIFRCAESTARVYLHNARRKLKRWLKEKQDVSGL